MPGMMEEPGCRPSSSISPRPANGPEFIQRRSLAIFINDTAVAFNWPDTATAVSCEPIRANRCLPGVNGTLLNWLNCALKCAANSGWALMPVPTAVPPWASACRLGRRLFRWPTLALICSAQPPSTWLMRTGMASIK
ncbi:hypothetical protein D3C76_1230000 [compost metagenome]